MDNERLDHLERAQKELQDQLTRAQQDMMKLMLKSQNDMMSSLKEHIATVMTKGDKGKMPLEDIEPKTNDIDPVYPPGFIPPRVQERPGDIHQE